MGKRHSCSTPYPTGSPGEREHSKQAVDGGAVPIRSTDLDNVPPLLFELTVEIQGKI